MEDHEERDPWMSWVPILLHVVGAAHLLLGVGGILFLTGAGGLMATSGVGNDGAWVFGVMLLEAVFIGGVTFGIGAVHFAAGWGFGRGAKWGWFGALILGAIWAPSACLPVGVAILYGCLNQRTRTRFIG